MTIVLYGRLYSTKVLREYFILISFISTELRDWEKYVRFDSRVIKRE